MAKQKKPRRILVMVQEFPKCFPPEYMHQAMRTSSRDFTYVPMMMNEDLSVREILAWFDHVAPRYLKSNEPALDIMRNFCIILCKLKPIPWIFHEGRWKWLRIEMRRDTPWYLHEPGFHNEVTWVECFHLEKERLFVHDPMKYVRFKKRNERIREVVMLNDRCGVLCNEEISRAVEIHHETPNLDKMKPEDFGPRKVLEEDNS